MYEKVFCVGPRTCSCRIWPRNLWRSCQRNYQIWSRPNFQKNLTPKLENKKIPIVSWWRRWCKFLVAQNPRKYLNFGYLFVIWSHHWKEIWCHSSQRRRTFKTSKRIWPKLYKWNWPKNFLWSPFRFQNKNSLVLMMTPSHLQASCNLSLWKRKIIIIRKVNFTRKGGPYKKLDLLI